jgi:hypothetical protein
MEIHRDYDYLGLGWCSPCGLFAMPGHQLCSLGQVGGSSQPATSDTWPVYGMRSVPSASNRIGGRRSFGLAIDLSTNVAYVVGGYGYLTTGVCESHDACPLFH